MRHLKDIVTRALDGHPPDAEEGHYALLAVNSLLAYLTNDVYGMMEREAVGMATNIQEVATQGFSRQRKCLEAPPRDWIGWQNDPANPDVQERRRLMKAEVRKQLH